MSAIWRIPPARATDRKFTTFTVIALGHSFWARFTYGQLAALAQNHYYGPVEPTANFCPTWLMKGVSGQTVSQYTARIGTDVTPFAPAAVLVSDCTNDLGNITNLANDYQNLVAGLIAAGVPPLGIGLVNQCFSGNTFPEANISTINSANAIIQSTANANGCCVVDVRTPYFNRRTASGAPISDDGVHPTIGSGTGLTNLNGDLTYCQWMMAGSAFQQ